MPVDPHTWADVSDWFTATIANGDFYRYNGLEFIPTGIQFHARRPVYKGWNPNVGVSTASGAWVNAFRSSGGLTAAVNVDSGGQFGWFMDNQSQGNVFSNLAGAGGLPPPGRAGGLMLVTGCVPWPVNSGSIQVALGSSAGVIPELYGSLQDANGSSVISTGWVLDIVDAAHEHYALLSTQSSGGASAVPGPAVDGSYSAVRLHAFWASIYQANGFTASAPSPVASWSPSSTVNAALLNGNAGIRDVLRVLNMPPLLRATRTSGTQSLTLNTDNVINTLTATNDSYSGFASNTYTVPQNGIYLVYGYVPVGSYTGSLSAGVIINGTTYYGPRAVGTGNSISASKTQIFSLNAGDTIQLIGNPSATVSTNGTAPVLLIVLKMGEQGVPSPLPTVPDTTYRWQAGTPGDLSALWNAHIANDLTFLTRRPYLLTYQGTAQTGIAMNTQTPVTMDTVAGIVHADGGDNYSGWNAGTHIYTAQRAGWYLAVEEMMLASPSLTANPWVTASVAVTPASGINPYDSYQRQNMPASGNFPGATAVGMYYLRAGDTIKPGVLTGASSLTTIGTGVSTPNVTSHFELVWLGE